jgi:hypothetical protein
VSIPQPLIPSPRSAADGLQPAVSFDAEAYERATREVAHRWEDQPDHLLSQVSTLGLVLLTLALLAIGIVWGPR